MTVAELRALLDEWRDSLVVCVDGLPVVGIDHADEFAAQVVSIDGHPVRVLNLTLGKDAAP